MPRPSGTKFFPPLYKPNAENFPARCSDKLLGPSKNFKAASSTLFLLNVTLKADPVASLCCPQRHFKAILEHSWQCLSESVCSSPVECVRCKLPPPAPGDLSIPPWCCGHALGPGDSLVGGEDGHGSYLPAQQLPMR